VAATSYPVSTVPNVLFQGGQHQPADTLVNTGTTVIYVDNQPQITTTQGYALNPNAMYPVEANSFLSVVCPTTGTVQLLGRSGLNYWDPQQIATAINLIGVPAIDRAAVVSSAAALTVTRGFTITQGPFDVSSYSTLYLSVTEVNGAAGSVTAGLRNLQIESFSDAAATNLMATESWFYWPSGPGNLGPNGSGPQLLLTPVTVKGPFIKLFWNAIAFGAATATVSYRLVGSFRSPAPQIVTNNAQARAGFLSSDGSSGIAAASGAFPAGTTDEFPVTFPGPAFVQAAVGATTTATSSMRLIDPDSLQPLWEIAWPTSANAQAASAYLVLPLKPFILRVVNGNVGANGGSLVVTMDAARY
jgi:hypothetical protein